MLTWFDFISLSAGFAAGVIPSVILMKFIINLRTKIASNKLIILFLFCEFLKLFVSAIFLVLLLYFFKLKLLWLVSGYLFSIFFMFVLLIINLRFQ